jgi:hypothetical protein
VKRCFALKKLSSIVSLLTTNDAFPPSSQKK